MWVAERGTARELTADGSCPRCQVFSTEWTGKKAWIFFPGPGRPLPADTAAQKQKEQQGADLIRTTADIREQEEQKQSADIVPFSS